METISDICDCIKSSKDKEELLIVLDDAIRKENEEISHINENIEKAIMLMDKEDKNSDFYFAMKDSVRVYPHILDLHEEYKIRLKILRKKIEDTKEC